MPDTAKAQPPMREAATTADNTATPDRPDDVLTSDVETPARADAPMSDDQAAPLVPLVPLVPLAPDAIAAQLGAWRDGGVDRRDPARFHRIEALSQRLQAYRGEVRRVLETRLGMLAAELAKSLGDTQASSATREAPGTASPLAVLTTEVTQRIGVSERPAPSTAPRPRGPAAPGVTAVHTPAPAQAQANATASPKRPVTPPAPAPVAITPTVIATDDAFEDLDVLEYFRETWSKLSTDGNLRQSLAQVPENAGPLNSSHLVHRALSLMHDVSPDYLRHFLRHADALSWLEDMETTGVFGNKSAARVAASAKPSRAKAR
ncbi:DUF2894 domain-containing protein [Pandoraea sp. ISTKB]|uniref:DUF2894 domain-containing protein n=1 Tax=Pandoraea sp. ISTKB TaxID=1586708 RepID=UPI000AFF027A|nr:DUF2894 domain-containing protein [Pandoraea sp. ISTKB]